MFPSNHNVSYLVSFIETHSVDRSYYTDSAAAKGEERVAAAALGNNAGEACRWAQGEDYLLDPSPAAAAAAGNGAGPGLAMLFLVALQRQAVAFPEGGEDASSGVNNSMDGKKKKKKEGGGEGGKGSEGEAILKALGNIMDMGQATLLQFTDFLTSSSGLPPRLLARMLPPVHVLLRPLRVGNDGGGGGGSGGGGGGESGGNGDESGLGLDVAAAFHIARPALRMGLGLANDR